MAKATNILLAALGGRPILNHAPVKTYENGKIVIGDQAQRWKTVKELIGVDSNRDVAEYLLNLYEKHVGELVVKGNSGQSLYALSNSRSIIGDGLKNSTNSSKDSDFSDVPLDETEMIIEKVVPEIIEVSPAVFDFDFDSESNDDEEEDEESFNGYASESCRIEHPDYFTSTVQEKIATIAEELSSGDGVTEPPYMRCKLCTRLIQTKSFQHHMSNKHGGPIQCNICHITFKNNNSLRSHKHQIHSGPVRCEYCGVVKKNRGAYREHKAHYHEPRMKNTRKPLSPPLYIQCHSIKKLKSDDVPNGGNSADENSLRALLQQVAN